MTLTIEMPLGGWEAVLRVLEAAAQDESDSMEQMRLETAFNLFDDAISDAAVSSPSTSG